MVLNLISGLGADEKVFARLDLAEFEVNHVKWISHEPNETLQHYAQRLSKQVVTKEPYAIAGLSFGGILTNEITAFIEPKPVKSFLISSVRNWHQLSDIMQKGRKYPIHKLLPTPLLKIGNPFTYWYFGLKTENQKNLLKQLLSNSDPVFVKWAINEIVNWDREQSLENVIQMHGDKDLVFPIQNNTPDHVIKGGSHFMVYTHANLVSEILKSELA
jgi:hypothetical protein